MHTQNCSKIELICFPTPFFGEPKSNKQPMSGDHKRTISKTGSFSTAKFLFSRGPELTRLHLEGLQMPGAAAIPCKMRTKPPRIQDWAQGLGCRPVFELVRL